MGRAIPANGFPSRTDAAEALRAKGLDNPEIARRLGITAHQVANLLASRRRHRARRKCEVESRTVVIPRDTLDMLEPDATQREMSVNALVRALVVAIAEDNLTGAILDDGPRERSAR